MAEQNDLYLAVERVEALLRQSWDLAGDDFLDRRKEAIALRRSISDQTLLIGKLGEATFAAPAAKDAFRQHFSAARAAMVAHHASWPIVSIDLKSNEYRASATAMRSAYEGFIAWIKRSSQQPRNHQGLP